MDRESTLSNRIAHSGNDDDSDAVRRKSDVHNGDSHSLVTADRAHNSGLPPRPVLKKSHKKVVSKSEVGIDAGIATFSAAMMHPNGHGLGMKSLHVQGAGAGPREMHGISKRVGGPSYMPSSSLLHPQPSVASQRQRRTDGATAGELLISFLASPVTLLHYTSSLHIFLSYDLNTRKALYLS